MSVTWTLAPHPISDGIAVLSAKPPPTRDALLAHTDAWLEAHTGPAFRDAMRELLRRGLLDLELQAPADELRPAPEVLRHPEEAAVPLLQGAPHAMIAHAANLPGQPPWGTWLALSAARASALLLDGVVVDPLTWSVEPMSWRHTPPASHVPVPVGGYVSFTWEPLGDRIRLLTRGLSRVGLPELAADDLSPGDLHNARWVLLGAAWALLRDAVQAGADTLLIDSLVVDAEAMLSAAVDPQAADRQATPAPLTVHLAPLDERTLRVTARDHANVGAALRRSPR